MAARDERVVHAHERLPAPVRGEDVGRDEEAVRARDEGYARVRERRSWRGGGGGDGGVRDVETDARRAEDAQLAVDERVFAEPRRALGWRPTWALGPANEVHGRETLGHDPGC